MQNSTYIEGRDVLYILVQMSETWWTTGSCPISIVGECNSTGKANIHSCLCSIINLKVNNNAPSLEVDRRLYACSNAGGFIWKHQHSAPHQLPISVIKNINPWPRKLLPSVDRSFASFTVSHSLPEKTHLKIVRSRLVHLLWLSSSQYSSFVFRGSQVCASARRRAKLSETVVFLKFSGNRWDSISN
jgi:hypothetical protein